MSLLIDAVKVLEVAKAWAPPIAFRVIGDFVCVASSENVLLIASVLMHYWRWRT